MNKKLVFGSMLAVLLVLSLSVIGCKTDDDGIGGGGDVSIAITGDTAQKKITLTLSGSDATWRQQSFNESLRYATVTVEGSARFVSEEVDGVKVLTATVEADPGKTVIITPKTEIPYFSLSSYTSGVNAATDKKAKITGSAMTFQF